MHVPVLTVPPASVTLIAIHSKLLFTEGRRFLTDFLKGEFSDENILFWQACEELKRESNHEKIEEKARIIYEDFISILSPKEVGKLYFRGELGGMFYSLQ